MLANLTAGDIGRKEPLKEPPPNRRTIQVRKLYLKYFTFLDIRVFDVILLRELIIILLE